MKNELEAKIGKKLDNVAKIVVEAALGCMGHEMAGRQACNEYKEKLFDAFTS